MRAMMVALMLVAVFPVVVYADQSCTATCSGGSCSITIKTKTKKQENFITGATNNAPAYSLVDLANLQAGAQKIIDLRPAIVESIPESNFAFDRMQKGLESGDAGMIQSSVNRLYNEFQVYNLPAPEEVAALASGVSCTCGPNGTPICEEI